MIQLEERCFVRVHPPVLALTADVTLGLLSRTISDTVTPGEPWKWEMMDGTTDASVVLVDSQLCAPPSKVCASSIKLHRRGSNCPVTTRATRRYPYGIWFRTSERLNNRHPCRSATQTTVWWGPFVARRLCLSIPSACMAWTTVPIFATANVEEGKPLPSNPATGEYRMAFSSYIYCSGRSHTTKVQFSIVLPLMRQDWNCSCLNY